MKKRVVLIGDSIRLGYQATVREQLAAEAFVWSPNENGQHSTNLLLMFWEWVASQQPDVLHINAGLWDMRRVVPGESGRVVEIEVYKANVARLIELARRHTTATIIWATTTPVNDAHANRTHRRIGIAGRSAQDVAIYNQTAIEVVTELGAAINDLYNVAQGAGLESVLSEDGVHFNEEGYRMLGEAVAAAIRKAI